ncbi:hypothetical protein COOONC_06865 [Cooperia oncophora]
MRPGVGIMRRNDTPDSTHKINVGGTWTCRSVVYDYNWRICDMFAVATAVSPFTLVEYEGRDYFEYHGPLIPPVGTND